MKKIKFITVTLALLLAVGAFCSCSSFKYDNSTIIAKVISIEGQKVNFAVGETSFDESMMPGNMQGGMTPPSWDVSFPEMPYGEIPEGVTIPDGATMPDGGAMPDFFGNGMPQNMPYGTMPDMFGGNFPEGFEGSMSSFFTESGDTVSLTLNEETVKTLSVGDIVMITFGDNGTVESLTPFSASMTPYGNYPKG